MEAFKLRTLKSGVEYEHLFPGANGGDHTVKRDASLDNTMQYIPKVVRKTLGQTEKIAKHLKGKTVYETCKKLWHFVYEHIQYRKDKQGYEQIRSPARTWHDRRTGVDCDCYSVFISSVLSNLGIPHILRITKYRQNYFQHIYPIVPNGSSYITMDCVTDRFDYEVPFSEKKDYPMELQFLDGVPNLDGGDDLGELGKLIKKNLAKKAAGLPLKTGGAKKQNLFQKIKAKAKAAPPPAPGSSTDAPKPKKKKFLGKVLNKINKINPATVLLRNGVLASMKLNVKKVASRLRWSYLTPDQAAQKGIDPERFKRLVATRQKLENIFYGAGGKIENLKKAILGGKGNKDKAVSGLGVLPISESLDYIDVHTPLQTLLGPEIYYAENVDGMEGFAGLGELGEPLSLTSVAAAAGVIAGIVGSLKQIGDIFKGKGKGSDDFDESKTEETTTAITDSSPATQNIIAADQPNNAALTTASLQDETTQQQNENTAFNTASAMQEENEESLLPTVKGSMEQSLTTSTEKTMPPAIQPGTTDNKESFWTKNKSWLKPTAMVGGGIAVIAIGYYLSKPKKKALRPQGLSGFHNRKKKKNHHRSAKHKRKIAVALL